MDAFDLSSWPVFRRLHPSSSCIITSVAIDSREVKPGALFIALKGSKQDGHHYVQEAFERGASAALVHQSYQGNGLLIPVDDPLLSLQELAAIYRRSKKALFVGITGSKGKTMVKDLLFSLLCPSYQVAASPESFNSQIGVALSLFQVEDRHDIALIEAGVSKVGEMDQLAMMIEPHHAILTCTEESPSSLPTKELIIQEKSKLLFAAKGWKLTPENPIVEALLFSNKLHYRIKGVSEELILHHPFPNALDLLSIGIKAALLLGIGMKDVIEALRSYRTQPMEFEITTLQNGAMLINAPYCQDPSSRRRAEEKLKEYSCGKRMCVQDEEGFAKIYPTLSHDDGVLVQGAVKIPLEELTHVNNQLWIDLTAVHHNFLHVQRTYPKASRFMPIIKANAYGTDAAILAKFLSKIGASIFGVAHPDEAIALRRKGIPQDIFVIHAAEDEAKKIATFGFEIGVSSKEMIEALAKTNKQVKVHLHVDTGMSRLGCRPEEVADLILAIKRAPNLIFEGIWTHFACADDPSQDAFSRAQTECFMTAIQELSVPWIHAANSCATLRQLFPQGNLARIGLALYGCKEPALTLTSRIVAINRCKRGESISYGRTYVVQNDEERIAVIPIGYFDGFHRHYSGKGEVIIRGKRAPMVGTICMDFMMINISHIPDAQVGDSVLLFGKDAHGHTLSLEEQAARMGTDPHELVACLGQRIQRIFIER